MAKHSESIFFAVALILIGALFLLRNMGLITGTIWRWWPALLIIWGVSKLLKAGQQS